MKHTPSTSLAALLLLASPAAAGPPFVTDDPEPTPYRHYELNFFFEGTQKRGATEGVALPSCDCNYGILPNLELTVEPVMVFNKVNGEPLQVGLGDTEFAVKYRFIEQDETSWIPSVAFAPSLTAPTGDAARRLGTGRTHAFLPLWIGKDFGDWTTYGGGGYGINPGPGKKNFWFVGWVLERKITDKLTLGVELFHQTPTEIGNMPPTGVGEFLETPTEITGMQSTSFNIGGIYDITDNYHFLFSFGKGLQHAKETNAFSWYIGLQLTGGG